MPGILGKKIGMTQVFGENGQIIPATVIESGPCCVLQVKTQSSDGYSAIQLGFQDTKDSKVNKPLREKFKKIKVAPKRFIKEIPVPDSKSYQVGQKIDVAVFSPGDFVDIIGTSIGKGFQGGMKRWHWKGGPKSHGSTSHRAPGSIGASAFPSRVYKGHHLPGHMGNQRVTVQNLEVIKVDKDNNLLLLKGSVPGHKNSYLIIRKSRKKTQVSTDKKTQVSTDKKKTKDEQK